MQVEWYGQSAFRLEGAGQTVFVDPFGDVGAAAAERGLQFDYPPIAGVSADVVLVTHEHFDHNAVDALEGSPAVLRSTAGRLGSPVGEVVAIASEHDDAAGTERGPNTIFVFDLDGVRVAHMGDFGQAGLRAAQTAALRGIDLLIVPVGGGPTIGAEQAALVVETLAPRWVVPMHYRTERVNFLEPADGFLERFGSVARLESARFDTAELPDGKAPLIVVPATP
jgi:L-ascorbate metabolism protein UlaG (beta-lactamase superfamily)